MASPLLAALRSPASAPAASTSAASATDDRAAPGSTRLRRLLPGAGDPPWARAAFVLLLVGTAVLYLWDLGASGWVNAFYSAAAQAGAASWKAWFFGASDAPGLIMIDKPPVSVWVMGLSARLFGVNSWAILVPQALIGVASVGFLHAGVRRWAGPGAGLLAGTVLALTATLMFRFNNPDALFVLLLVAAAWAVVRAVDSTSPRSGTRWLLLAAALIGAGFLTKSLQAFLVLPAFTAVWLTAGPGRLRARLWSLLPTTAVLVLASGWWVAVVDLWPATDRPYVGRTGRRSGRPRRARDLGRDPDVGRRPLHADRRRGAHCV